MIRGLTSLSFSDELLQQGYEIDMHVDKIELITNAQIAEKLTIDPEQPILCVRRHPSGEWGTDRLSKFICRQPPAFAGTGTDSL